MSIRSFGTLGIATTLIILAGQSSRGADRSIEDPVAATAVAEPSVLVNWIDRYGEARRDSSSSNRPMLLFLTMDGCVHCTRMERDAFQDPSLAASLNSSFVPARIKTNMRSRLARELKVNIFPTTVFIAPDGKILDYIRGYIPKHQLNMAMNHAMDASAASVASRATP